MPSFKNITPDKILYEYNPNNNPYIHEDDVIGAMEEYANQRTASLIQTLENRVKELQDHQSDFKPTNSTYQELGYCIIELRNLLTLLKS